MQQLSVFNRAILGIALSQGTQVMALEKSSPVPAYRIAFISDVHLHDVYGKIDGFDGLQNSKSKKNAVIRTMYAQLTSTRLFNENYFAFRAALDQIHQKGVRLVALPGDYTDDAQPINIDGLRRILEEYEAKGMRFFLSPGNHDPNEPFDDEGGKDDFLGADGKNLKIFSPMSAACLAPSQYSPVEPATVVCAEQIRELGYAGIIDRLAAFGYKPRAEDYYWETPFSSPKSPSAYSFAAAVNASSIDSRQFEICYEGAGGPYKQEAYTNCSYMTDASYLVEPVPGLWILSIDANVYRPKAKDGFDALNPEKASNFSGSSDAGYDLVRTHKTHLLPWITSVVKRAREQGKQLVAFSHFPLSEFYNGQSDRMTKLFKPKAFQMVRRPNPETTEVFAATGLNLHVAGHMHMNNTGIYSASSSKHANSPFLVNIQAPSLGVFGAAYKLLSFRRDHSVEVETVALDNVPRFDELFEHYENEWQSLNSSALAEDKVRLWNRDILKTTDYFQYTRFYFGELSRLRFLQDYWPCVLKEAVTKLDGAQLLTLSQLTTGVSLAQLKEVPEILPLPAISTCPEAEAVALPTLPAAQLREDWLLAEKKAQTIAEQAGLQLKDFSALSPQEFYSDFHRTVYAGELGFRRMDTRRIKVYETLFKAYAHSEVGGAASQAPAAQSISKLLVVPLKEVFAIFDGLLHGSPADRFIIDLKSKKLFPVQN